MGDLDFLHARLTALPSALSPSSLNTCPAKLNTFGQKLDTSAPKLNTFTRPTEHIPVIPAQCLPWTPIRGRDPAAPNHPTAPKSPLAPHPHQVLRTSYSDSHHSLLSAHSFPCPLALRNHFVYTRDTLSHAHTPDPPCSSASSHSSHSSHFSPSWRPGAVPACSSPSLGIGLNPASSGPDASAPTPRHLRAPSVPSAVLLSPHSPNLRRRSAKKSAQAVSGQPEPP